MSSSFTLPQYKMHAYAIFVIEQLQHHEMVAEHLDPYSLDLALLSEFIKDPEDTLATVKIIQQQEKEKRKNNRKESKKRKCIVCAPKPDIIENIVKAYYTENIS